MFAVAADSTHFPAAALTFRIPRDAHAAVTYRAAPYRYHLCGRIHCDWRTFEPAVPGRHDAHGGRGWEGTLLKTLSYHSLLNSRVSWIARIRIPFSHTCLLPAPNYAGCPTTRTAYPAAPRSTPAFLPRARPATPRRRRTAHARTCAHCTAPPFFPVCLN